HQVAVLGRGAGADGGDAVAVALHQVAAKPAADAERAFQVDGRARRQRTERRSAQVLGPDVGGEGGAGGRGDGEAAPVDRDGVTGARVRGDPRAPHSYAGRAGMPVHRDDLAALLHDAGEHPASPPPGPAGLRGARARVAPAMTGRAARVRPPIRTFTVGPGFHRVNRPLALGALAGSRTVTAGSEFHRPRSTLLLR